MHRYLDRKRSSCPQSPLLLLIITKSDTDQLLAIVFTKLFSTMIPREQGSSRTQIIHSTSSGEGIRLSHSLEKRVFFLLVQACIMTVFDDPLYVDFYDPDHSYDEHRYLIIGESQQRRLLIVSYTERGDITRLISAREMTPAERRDYEKG